MERIIIIGCKNPDIIKGITELTKGQVEIIEIEANQQLKAETTHKILTEDLHTLTDHLSKWKPPKIDVEKMLLKEPKQVYNFPSEGSKYHN